MFTQPHHLFISPFSTNEYFLKTNTHKLALNYFNRIFVLLRLRFLVAAVGARILHNL